MSGPVMKKCSFTTSLLKDSQYPYPVRMARLDGEQLQPSSGQGNCSLELSEMCSLFCHLFESNPFDGKYMYSSKLHLFSRMQYRNAPRPSAETSSATKSRGTIMVAVGDEDVIQGQSVVGATMMIDTSDWMEQIAFVSSVVLSVTGTDRYCVVRHCRSPRSK